MIELGAWVVTALVVLAGVGAHQTDDEAKFILFASVVVVGGLIAAGMWIGAMNLAAEGC